MTQIAQILGTWFGFGLIPGPRGTWGSLAALPVAWGLTQGFGLVALMLGTVAVTLVGVWASDVMVRTMSREDPGEIVIDEVAGQWLTLALVGSVSLPALIVSFVLFRVCDILKPWPANVLDRRVKGGLGVMADDLMAGVYAGLLSWLLLEVVPWPV